jgi:hypothetical protein
MKWATMSMWHRAGNHEPDGKLMKMAISWR